MKGAGLGKNDNRINLAKIPSAPPPPSAGNPVGSSANGGHALGGGFVGNVGRAWEPARAPGGACQCASCGSWQDELGNPFDAEAARLCCDPEAVKDHRTPRMLNGEQRDRIRRHTRGGMWPKEILEHLRLPQSHKNAVQAVYDDERRTIMRQKGLDLAGWKRLQANRRRSRQYHAIPLD